jgi:hypothetical protein
VAQVVIEAALKNFGPEFFLDEANLDFTQKFIEETLPYTERHADRINKMCQNVEFLDFVWHNIKQGIKGENNADLLTEDDEDNNEKTELEEMLELMKIEDAKQKARRNVSFE